MSLYIDAPKRFVVDISLSRPKILEEKVQKLTFIELKKFCSDGSLFALIKI